jgi:hypothetical protein
MMTDFHRVLTDSGEEIIILSDKIRVDISKIAWAHHIRGTSLMVTEPRQTRNRFLQLYLH